MRVWNWQNRSFLQILRLGADAAFTTFTLAAIVYSLNAYNTLDLHPSNGGGDADAKEANAEARQSTITVLVVLVLNVLTFLAFRDHDAGKVLLSAEQLREKDAEEDTEITEQDRSFAGVNLNEKKDLKIHSYY